MKNFDYRVPPPKKMVGTQKGHMSNLEENLGMTAQFGNFTKNETVSKTAAILSQLRLPGQNIMDWVA